MGSAKSDIMKSRKNLKSTCLKTVEPKAVKCPIQDGEAKWHMRLLFPVFPLLPLQPENKLCVSTSAVLTLPDAEHLVSMLPDDSVPARAECVSG